MSKTIGVYEVVKMFERCGLDLAFSDCTGEKPMIEYQWDNVRARYYVLSRVVTVGVLDDDGRESRQLSMRLVEWPLDAVRGVLGGVMATRWEK